MIAQYSLHSMQKTIQYNPKNSNSDRFNCPFKSDLSVKTLDSLKRIVHKFSCIIEFIERVQGKNVRRAEHFIAFCNEFDKFNKT